MCIRDSAKATGTGKLLVKVCPAHVYSENEDGTIAVEYLSLIHISEPTRPY